jgi:hypothetical protein
METVGSLFSNSSYAALYACYVSIAFVENRSSIHRPTVAMHISDWITSRETAIGTIKTRNLFRA